MARTYSTAKFAGKQHHHGCTDCRRRYVCACDTPQINSTCNSCRSGRVGEGARAWEPQPCCLADYRLCETYDRDVHKLAGPGPWFRCRTCARTFPCKPEQVKTHD